MLPNSYYLTTPIYYVNSLPHLGHAYTSILADASIRFHKMLGERTFLLSGTDEHGDKIIKAAEAQNDSPEEFVNKISAKFKELMPKIGVHTDYFTRTTCRKHIEKVQALLQQIYEAGDIYYGEFGGWYCYGCERFYTEKELENGLCPQHLRKPEFISEKNYFFRMSKYIPWLLQYLKDNPTLIRPERYRKEALSMLESGELEDLCISRPKTRLAWGIELPFDHEYVTYVWFDALVSYISAIDWPNGAEFKEFWPGEHLIAKDILKPHAIFWPCMLKAANLPVYRHLNVHGYWLSRNTKMSKSLGNVVDPIEMTERFGLDCFRYFLLRDMRFGSDASMNEENMILLLNADLANDIGNLFSRVLSMANHYFNSRMPSHWSLKPQDHSIIASCGHAIKNYIQLLSSMEFSSGLEELVIFAGALNKYIDAEAPWSLFKRGEMERLETVLNVLIVSMRKIALCLWPVMPDAASKMLNQLGEKADAQIPPVQNLKIEADNFVLPEQSAVLAESSNIFPRLETKKAEVYVKEAPKKEKKQQGRETSLDEFTNFRVTAGRIVKAEKHPDATRLLILELDFGQAGFRTIISGLAEYYSPQELTGRMVCAILNLPARKIRGVESRGMVLTAEFGHQLRLLDPGQDVPPGTPIK